MSQLTLGSCAPDVLLSHLALYGLAAILESGGITGLRAGWNGSGDRRPYLTGLDLTGERAAEVVSRHACQAAGRGSWLHHSITLNGSPRALMSPRLTTFGDQTTWRQAQENRHKVLDSLTAHGRWLDLRFLAALGEPELRGGDLACRVHRDGGSGRRVPHGAAGVVQATAGGDPQLCAGEHGPEPRGSPGRLPDGCVEEFLPPAAQMPGGDGHAFDPHRERELGDPPQCAPRQGVVGRPGPG